MVIKALLILVVVGLLVGGGYYYSQIKTSDQSLVTPTETNMETTAESAPEPFNFGGKKFKLDDQILAFTDGKAMIYEPKIGTHSATVSDRTLSASGNLAAAILIDNPGGSGTFYYLVVGKKKDTAEEIYSEPVLLGDRIQFQKLEVEDAEAHDNGEIVVTYLDHGPNDPMYGEPTKQMEKKYSFEDNGNLIEALH